MAGWINANETGGLGEPHGHRDHRGSRRAGRRHHARNAGNTQPYGLLHGGASCVLAETLGSVGSALHAGVPGHRRRRRHQRHASPLGASWALVTGVATALHRGRTMATYEVVITDEDGRRVCTARITCLIRPATIRSCCDRAAVSRRRDLRRGPGDEASPRQLEGSHRVLPVRRVGDAGRRPVPNPSYDGWRENRDAHRSGWPRAALALHRR